MQIIELKNDFSLLIALWAGNKQNKTPLSDVLQSEKAMCTKMYCALLFVYLRRIYTCNCLYLHGVSLEL